MNPEPNKWDETILGKMSLENIRKLYQPESHYRLTWNKYPSETKFVGWDPKRRLFVIYGSCSITVNEYSINLCAGEFADISEGFYRGKVSLHSQVEIVSVWEIPKQYRITNGFT
jgi:hypothetical protein